MWQIKVTLELPGRKLRLYCTGTVQLRPRCDPPLRIQSIRNSEIPDRGNSHDPYLQLSYLSSRRTFGIMAGSREIQCSLYSAKSRMDLRVSEQICSPRERRDLQPWKNRHAIHSAVIGLIGCWPCFSFTSICNASHPWNMRSPFRKHVAFRYCSSPTNNDDYEPEVAMTPTRTFHKGSTVDQKQAKARH